MLVEARSERGGYSNRQIQIARTLTKVQKSPISALVGRDISLKEWNLFLSAKPRPLTAADLKAKADRKERRRKKKLAKRMLNAVSGPDGDWSWRPKRDDIPPPKFATSADKKNKNQRKRKWRSDRAFYESDEWRKLRARVLEKYGCRCMMCGRTPKQHRIVVHVDHIKPRSKYPELELEFNNLQVLCEDCNLGKGNRYSTDYRPDAESDDSEKLAELELVLAAQERI